MVNCATPYASDFENHRSLLIGLINSGPARFGRICRFHPGVIDRPHEDWALGYSPNFPETLFRREFIIGLVSYHFRILSFGNDSIRIIIVLKDFMMALKRMCIVRIIHVFPRKNIKKKINFIFFKFFKFINFNLQSPHKSQPNYHYYFNSNIIYAET